MKTLKNRVVLITGASIGIGREDAFKFAAEGCKLVITYARNSVEANDVARKCKELGSPQTLVLPLDVRADESIRSCVKTVIDTFGEISILINNAGIILWRFLEEQSFEEIGDQVRTNLEGLIKMTYACLPHTKDMIINMSSAAGLDGYPRLTTYCATKWGVRGFTKALAEEMPDIAVYSVNPGVIATQMNDFRGMPPEKVAEVILNLAKGAYELESGSDVNIWDYVEG